MAEDPFTPRTMPWLRRDAMNGMRLDSQLRANRDAGLASDGTAPLRADDIEALKRLQSADLFWISAEMSELCHDATADLDAVHLGHDLWPAEAGFMVFATPVPVDGFEWHNANDASLEPIRALLWYPEDSTGLAVPGGAKEPAKAVNATTSHHAPKVTVLLFTDLRAMVEATVHRLNDGDIDSARVASNLARFAGKGIRYLASAGGDMYRTDKPLTRAGEESAPLGEPAADETHPSREVTNVRIGGCPAGVMLSTVWLLMGQRGLATTRTGVAKPKNKAAARRAAPVQDELDRVRIIEIRAGTDHAAAYSGTTRTHRHRWMVKGHWRQQYYPSSKTNRPVWIAPHLKGPEGAPMLTGQKVYTWKGR